MIVGLAQLICGQHLGNTVESAPEIAESRESVLEGTETSVHCFYYRRVCRGGEVSDCAILREVNLTTRKMLSHRALN